MTDQRTQKSAAANGPWIAVILPCVLIAHLAWNLLIPAHEFPLRTEQVLTMTFDALMVVGLISQVRDATTLVCHANYDVMRGLVNFLVAECCADAAEDKDNKTAA